METWQIDNKHIIIRCLRVSYTCHHHARYSYYAIKDYISI